MGADLGRAERARMTRGGLTPFTAETGMEAFDQALAAGTEALLVPMRMNTTAARASAEQQIPPLLRGLVRVPQRRATHRTRGPPRSCTSGWPGRPRTSGWRC